jgi:hypothetical protein
MISGNAEKPIKEYLLIDRCCESGGYIKARQHERLIGIPCGWYHESGTPFIEHWSEGNVTRTVNVADVSEIVFEV